MKAETIKKLDDFIKIQNKNVSKKNEYNGIISIFPADYKEFLDMYNGGSGSVGENSYLQLWAFEDIDELNKDYEVVEFLSNIVLIGSDGGDTAYGINQKGEFVEVPFIGMDDEEVKVVAVRFDDFIEYIYNK